MKKIFIILLLVLSITNIKAYENDYFKIDIPIDFKEEQVEDNIYKWTNNNKYIAITIADNSNLKYDISSYTDTDIEKQKEYLMENLNTGLEDYKVNVDVPYIKKIDLNDKTILRYSLYYPTKESTGYDIYQIGNVFTTKNYIITIIYSSDNEINESEYSFINNFEIKDDKVISINRVKYIYYIVAIGIILGVIGYILSLKKRK